MIHRVMLINVNDIWLAQDGEYNTDVLTPPIGLMYLSSYLKKYIDKKIEIKILDNVNDLRNKSKLVEYLNEYKPSIVGIRGLHSYRKLFDEFSTIIKDNSDCLLIGGGPYISSDSNWGLNSSKCDVTVYGEGETIFCEIVNKFIKGENIYNISRTAYKREGKIYFNDYNISFLDVDKIPIPDYDAINLSDYQNYLSYAYNKRLQGVLFTSRGCPYRCAFCHNNFGKVFRGRSPDNVLEEMKYLFSKGVRDFYILDDNFNFDLFRAKTILKKVIGTFGANSINLYFTNGLDSNNVDSEFFDLLEKAGCVYLGFAIETVSPYLLNRIRKNINIDKVKNCIIESDKRGFVVNYWGMIGLPGETIEDASALIDFMSSLPYSSVPMLFRLNPYPGTEISTSSDMANEDMDNYQNFIGLIRKEPLYLPLLERWEKHILSEHRLENVTKRLVHNGYTQEDIMSMYTLLYRSLEKSKILHYYQNATKNEKANNHEYDEDK